MASRCQSIYELFFQNGLYSSLPYIVLFIAVFPVGRLSGYLVDSGKLSTVAQRKLMNTFGFFGAAASLIWLSFIGCDSTMALLALCLAVGFYSGAYAGYFVSENKKVLPGHNIPGQKSCLVTNVVTMAKLFIWFPLILVLSPCGCPEGSMERPQNLCLKQEEIAL